MADKYDPYREALIVEETTIWPEKYDELDLHLRQRVEAAMHKDPESATNIEYLRMHTGFCRQITVTEEEVEQQLGDASSAS